MGLGETLRWSLAKLVMRAAGDQAKTACGNLQLCADLEAGIEGATHAVGQRRVERVMARRVEEEGAVDAAAEEPEEDGGEVAGCLVHLTIETVGTTEEAEKGLAVALEMEMEVDRASEGEEGGGGALRVLEALEFLTQEAEPIGTTLVDARNGFNNLSRLAQLPE